MSHRSLLIAAIVALSAVVRVTPASATLGDDDWLGTYHNARPSAAGIARITVFRPTDAMQIHVVGNCTPSPCDWSSALLTTFYDGPNGASKRFGIATFVQPDAIRMLVIEQTYDSGGALDVRTYTRFTDGNHHGDLARHDSFTRTGRDAGAPPQPAATAADNDGGLIGDWRAAGGDLGLARLIVSRDGGGALRAHVFGVCTPRTCDWGTVTLARYASEDGSAARATLVMTVGDTTRTIELLEAPGSDRLTGLVAVHFTSGRHVDYATHIDLIKGQMRFTL